MFTLDEAKILLNFLDRVKIKGHQEREDMTIIVNNLVNHYSVPQDVKETKEGADNENS